MTKKHWLLLRGLGRDSRHWGTFVSAFETAFADDTVSVIDSCGNGRFADQQSPLTISQYTDFCRQQRPSINSPFHVVALSLGGMIAQDWAQRFPTEIGSLTLINTSAANLTPVYQRIRIPTLLTLLATLLTSRSDRAIEQAILQATSNLSPTNPAQRQRFNQTLQQWQQYRSDYHTSVSNLIRQLIAAARFAAQPLVLSPDLDNHSLDNPDLNNHRRCLILASNQDHIVNVKASEALARLLAAPIRYHPTAGHDLPLDDGPWVIEQIQDQLAYLCGL